MQRSKPSAALPEVRITKAASHTRFSSLSLRKKKKKRKIRTVLPPLKAQEGQKGRLLIYQKDHTAPPGFTKPLQSLKIRSLLFFLQRHMLSKPAGRENLILKHMQMALML